MKTKKQNITSDVGVSLMYAQRGITLIALAISRKCVRYEERA